MKKTSSLFSFNAEARKKLYDEFKADRLRATELDQIWNVSFEQWWKIWERSKKHPLRGNFPGQYQWISGRIFQIRPAPERNLIELPSLRNSTATTFRSELSQRPRTVNTRLTSGDIAKAKKQYWSAKARAVERGIKWEFSFESWCKVWDGSGHYAERGTFLGQYTMQRILDGDTYAPTSVEIRVTRKQSYTIFQNRCS